MVNQLIPEIYGQKLVLNNFIVYLLHEIIIFLFFFARQMNSKLNNLMH